MAIVAIVTFTGSITCNANVRQSFKYLLIDNDVLIALNDKSDNYNKVDTIDFFDLVLKEKLLYRKNDGSLFTGKTIKKYPGTPKKIIREVKNGKYNGAFTAWYSDKQIAKRGVYVNGKLSGKFEEWYSNGNKKVEANYIKGELYGLSTSWYSNGKMREKCNYVNSEFNGNYLSWYENGKKYAEKNFVNGKKNGMFILWYDNGKKQLEIEYTKNKKNGRMTTWHKNGNKEEECTYLNNKINGKFSICSTTGAILRTGIYKNGVHLSGDEIY